MSQKSLWSITKVPGCIFQWPIWKCYIFISLTLAAAFNQQSDFRHPLVSHWCKQKWDHGYHVQLIVWFHFVQDHFKLRIIFSCKFRMKYFIFNGKCFSCFLLHLPHRLLCLNANIWRIFLIFGIFYRRLLGQFWYSHFQFTCLAPVLPWPVASLIVSGCMVNRVRGVVESSFKKN